MIKSWSDSAWEDYMTWQQQNNTEIVERVNDLIADIEKHPFTGLGKPTELRPPFKGQWSRRITQNQHLIYAVKNQTIYFYSVRDW